jgi:glucosamine--fructose-6-phosphate aminotransferase (isomerizing)
MPDYESGTFSHEEITSQGRAWAELIPLVTQHSNSILEIFNGIEEVIFTGCGSGLNAAYCGAPTFQALTDIPTRAIPAAETYLFPTSVLNKGRKALAVLLSRSGKTTEVVQALDAFRSMGVRTIGVTCTPGSPLASGSEVALVLLPVEERAVATTRSLSGMILTLQLMAAILGREQAYLDELYALPQICEALMPDFEDLGKRIGQRLDVERYAFVGNGPFYGIARECQLKVKEMALLPVDAYPLFDFRHGPQSNVNERMLVTAFISDSARAGEIHFLEDMKAFGGLTWGICERAGEGMQADYILALNAGISQLARPPLYLPSVQFMAYYRALSQGLNPDQPHQLSYWVDTTR